MQISGENSAFLENLIEKAKKILILVGCKPSVDNLAAGLALEEVLRTLGKVSQVYYRGEIPKVFNNFAAKINNKIEVKKLVVSFNWQKNQIEKVSYNLEGENFNFIISPLNKKIDSADLRISYQGEEADLIVTLGVSSLAEFNDISSDFFENRIIINFDKKENNQLFGKLNFVDPAAESICVVVAKIFENSQIPTSPVAADILLTGIRATTNNFERVSDPATFEAAAFCTRVREGKIRQQEPAESKTALKQIEVPKEWLSPKILRSKQTS